MYAAIDHQITLDLGGRNTRHLYEAASEGTPLVKAAAERLFEAADSGDRILLSTGFPIVPPVAPETDGPLGTVVLARALGALGATPVIVVEPMVEATISAVFGLLDCEFPIETVDPATAATESLLDRHDPDAAVAVEKPGQCADGSHRNMAGEPVSQHVASADTLFEQARNCGIPTVAVGDGGNEIGMGVVQSAVREHVDHGETIACVRPVDHLVVAGVSNWGAYGVVAALSLLADEPLLHSSEDERRLIEASLDAGCVDGVTGETLRCVDGIPSAVHAAVVDVLAEGCRAALDGA